MCFVTWLSLTFLVISLMKVSFDILLWQAAFRTAKINLLFFSITATATYRHASNIDPENKRATEGLNRVQKLQKQASKRDYYKILNVKRSATKKEIVKAYRKAAQKWHPDNFPDGDEKKVAEKKFIDIASAKEVLTDPEKRAKFDQGEDPLDPEQQSGFGGGGGGHPFHHFHFNQGPFHFKFQ
jgi:DnaJ family protein C protein 3